MRSKAKVNAASGWSVPSQAKRLRPGVTVVANAPAARTRLPAPSAATTTSASDRTPTTSVSSVPHRIVTPTASARADRISSSRARPMLKP